MPAKFFLLTKNEIYDKKNAKKKKNFFQKAISFFEDLGAGRLKLIINSTFDVNYGDIIFVGIGFGLVEI